MKIGGGGCWGEWHTHTHVHTPPGDHGTDTLHVHSLDRVEVREALMDRWLSKVGCLVGTLPHHHHAQCQCQEGVKGTHAPPTTHNPEKNKIKVTYNK